MFVSKDFFDDSDEGDTPSYSNQKKQRNNENGPNYYKKESTTQTFSFQRNSQCAGTDYSSNLGTNFNNSTANRNIESTPNSSLRRSSLHDQLYGIEDQSPTTTKQKPISNNQFDSTNFGSTRKSLASVYNNQEAQTIILQQSKPDTMNAHRGISTTDQIQNALMRQKQRLLGQQRMADTTIGTVKYNDMHGYVKREESSPLYYRAQEKASPVKLGSPSTIYQAKEETYELSPKNYETQTNKIDQPQSIGKFQEVNAQSTKDTYYRGNDELNKSSEESDNESEDNDNSQPPGLNIGEIVKKRPTTTLQNETKADDQVTQVSKQDDRPDNVSLLRLLDLGEPRSFAIGPAPKNHVIQCTIKRFKGTFPSFYTKYYVYLTNEYRYIMSAKKRAGNKTPNYAITMNPKNFSTKSLEYLGKLRANFAGTEYQIWDNGFNPKKTQSVEKIREQLDLLGLNTQDQGVSGKKSTANTKVLIPTVFGFGEQAHIKPLSSKEGMLADFHAGKTDGFEVYTSKVSQDSKSYDSSSGYFQLVKAWPNQKADQQVVLQFGRISDDTFSMDFQWPLSPFQAFAICLSIFDSKLECK